MQSLKIPISASTLLMHLVSNYLITFIEKLITENIIPNAEYIDGTDWRHEQLYTYSVNEIFARNEYSLKKIYD